MQARNIDTPRPRPPAKVRRSLPKGPSTPPPAYASTFPFPGTVTDEVASSMDTYLSTGWDTTDSLVLPNSTSPAPADDLAWLNDKSRDELTNLLVEADALIKERENELSLTSAACKTLYESNVALKTHHEVLLTRYPLSSAANANSSSTSSPTLSPQSPRLPLPHSHTLSRSTSESVIRASASPEHMLSSSYDHPPRRRRVVGSPPDFSFLADQNAELLSKIEKLEAEATSADSAGRRDLRRLEKDISVLKEELEKAQVRSDELEEKAKAGFGLGAEKIIEEVWKRRREREAKISALRRGVRENSEETTLRNFAPEGSLLAAPRPQPHLRPDFPLADDSIFEDESMVMEDQTPMQQDQQLITKLLEKIQELEATNSKILEQQTETTSRLQAVQRETEFMSKVYERFSAAGDANTPLELEEAEVKDLVQGGLVNRFSKSHRRLKSDLATQLRRQRSFHRYDSKIQVRPSVMGLFDNVQMKAGPSNLDESDQLPEPSLDSPWVRPRHWSSYSSASPASQLLGEPSPTAVTRQSLASELGNMWGNSNGASHRRGTSSSDLDQLSAHSTHSSLSLSEASTGPDHSDVGAVPNLKSFPTNPGLSIELPTPEKRVQALQSESMLIGNMSPRFRTARTLRSRNTLWSDNRYPDTFSRATAHRGGHINDSLSIAPRTPGAGLVDAFEAMVEEFDERSGIVPVATGSPCHSPLGTSEHEEVDENAAEGEAHENSLQVRPEHEVTQSRFTTVMVEVWMWLQFFIIMLVFLWAMARRGPKSVLVSTDRKRTISMKQRT